VQGQPIGGKLISTNWTTFGPSLPSPTAPFSPSIVLFHRTPINDISRDQTCWRSMGRRPRQPPTSRACTLREHPTAHRNLATYYGHQASNGRITGLRFQKYRETLMDRVNPSHFNKSMFILSEGRAKVRKKAVHYLQGIEAGI
jgi:hypothetical protein